jgi:hypothetical protein
MLKLLTAIALFILSGCATDPRIVGSAETSCGRNDGGAYEISIPMGAKTISLHAEGFGARITKWELAPPDVSICDTGSTQCVRAKSGELILSHQSPDKISGKLSFTLVTGEQQVVTFQAALRHRYYVCG